MSTTVAASDLSLARGILPYSRYGWLVTERRVAWLSAVAANPAAVVNPGATYEPDFYRAHGEGTVVGPPAAPITVDDLYRAVLLSGESDEDARQIADDFAPDVDRPGAIWVGDVLLYVALLSPEHEERIRQYLKLAPQPMAQELARVRGEIAERAT